MDKAASVAEAAAPVVASAAPVATPVVSAPPIASAPVPDKIAAQHVLVAYKGAKGADKTITRSKADAKKRADEVLAKANAGADFSQLATEYSDDPRSKTRQGSVGTFSRDQMVKPFADAAFALKVDEVSSVIESESGFHVIKRNQ